MENHFKLFTTEIDVLENFGDSFNASLQEVIGKGERKVFILTDENVASLWLEKIENIIKPLSKEISHFIIIPGESSKNRSCLFNIIDSLAAGKYTREDVFLALGGGVVSDLGSLAAGLYMRGMRLIIMPTSLLGMVDASIGEKTAIDTEYGKNIVGMFYRPRAIIITTEFLKTLPDSEMQEGMAEVIKTSLLLGGSLAEKLMAGEYDIFEIVSLCVKYKISIVEKDEFDVNERHLLNLGHTIAHAIEILSGYTVSHGRAVSVGLFETCKITFENYMCTKKCVDYVEKLLLDNNLPMRIKEVLPNATAKELANAVLIDKKTGVSGNISLAMPIDVGNCVVKSFPAFYAESVFEKALK